MHRKRTTADTSTQAARPVRHSDKPSRRYLGIRPVAVLAAAAASLLTVGVFAGSIAAGAATPHATSTVGGSFVGVTPARLADTRAGSGEQDAGKTLGANGTINVQVTGDGGVPASGVSAVVLNVTAVNPTALSFLAAYPEGGTQPSTANMVFSKGETLSNLVTVPVGSQGGVTILNHTGNVDVVVDVDGYYTTLAQTTGNYDAVAPDRVLGSTTTTGAALQGSTSTAVTIAGVDGIPADASAVVANLTASAGTAEGFLTAFPDGATRPLAANMVYGQGQLISNRITIPIGSDGKIDIYNNTGTVNVDLDVNGYYTGSGTEIGSTFASLPTPLRFTDTRTPLNGTPIAAGATETFSFAGDSSIPSTATALASNVTVIAGNSPGFLTNFPTTESTPPIVADMVWPGSGSIVQNFTDAPLNGGATNMYNQAGGSTINLVIDAFGYFAPQSGVQVSASPASIAADNGVSSSAISVTVDSNGHPVSGDPVVLAVTPAATCGALSATTGTTNSSGQVTGITYSSSATPGACTVTVTEADSGLTGSTTITQTAVNSVAVTAIPSHVPGDGASTSAISANVKNAAGAEVAGDVVTFSTSGGVDCGTLNPTSATTSAGGIANTTYTASASGPSGGFCTITATEGNLKDTGTALIDQTSVPSITGLAVAFTAPQGAIIAANGTSTTPVTGTVKQGATPIANDQVVLSVSPAACGTVSPVVVTTSATGTFNSTYTSSTDGSPGGVTCTITGTEADAQASGTTTVIQKSVNSVTLAANPSSVAANGAGTSTLTAMVVSTAGAPVSGDLITLTPTATPAGACGTIGTPTPATGETNASGVVTFPYTSSTTVGFCSIVATEQALAPGTGQSSTPATIRQGSTSGGTSTVTVSSSRSTVPADNGTTTSTITTTVTSSGSPVFNDPVAFTLTPSVANACDGGLSTNSGTTNSSGQVTVTFFSSDTPGTCTITAAEANSGQSGSTTITETASNAVAVTATPSHVPGDGATTSAISAHVTGTAGGDVAGDVVTFSTSGGADCGTLNPTTATTSAGGIAASTYTASASGPVAGFCTVTATEANLHAAGSAVIDQTSQPSISGLTVAFTAPTGNTITANGTSTTPITGTVKQGAVGIVGDTVLLTSSTPGCGTISPSQVVTTTGGAFSSTYTSSTLGATCTITGQEAENATTGTATVVQNAANNATLAANPSTVPVGGSSTFTVTVTSSVGAPVAGDAVSLTLTPTTAGACGTTGTPTPATGQTNASGVVTFPYTASGVVGFCQVFATEAGTGSQSNTVQVTQTA